VTVDALGLSYQFIQSGAGHNRPGLIPAILWQCLHVPKRSIGYRELDRVTLDRNTYMRS
jgi:hypothetical protein